MQANHLFAFDFDGVICDSAGEVGLSAWRAARLLWPQQFAGPAGEDYVQQFRACRPVVERGHESVGVAWLLAQGVSVAAILAGFRDMLEESMRSQALNAADYQAALSTARDHWIASAFDDWVAAQGFYPGVVEAVNALRARRVVVTAKPERFTRHLVRKAALDIADDRIFGLESFQAGSKRDVLEKLQAEQPATTIHFFEDRLATLEPLTEMGDVHLYLVDWGYNTDGQRAEAAANAAITLLSPGEFQALLADY